MRTWMPDTGPYIQLNELVFYRDRCDAVGYCETVMNLRYPVNNVRQDRLKLRGDGASVFHEPSSKEVWRITVEHVDVVNDVLERLAP